MWLVVYHPHQRKDGGASLPQATKDKLFITSLENVEYSILLETEARTMKWGWLFRTYVQWHAIAFLLSELCVRTKGEAVERAWRALEATAGRWWFPLNDISPYRKGQQGCLWRPLRKLLAKARAAREKEIRLEQASQAVRNEQRLSTDYSWVSPNALPPITVDQPSSDDLDQLLRPSAPKLGEMSMHETPASWPGSPVSFNTGQPITGYAGENLGQAQKAQNRRSVGFGSQIASPGQQFQHLTDYGLDNVMDGQGYSSLNAVSQVQGSLHSAQTTQPDFSMSAQPVMADGVNLNTGVYASDQQFFANLGFEDMTATGATNGQSNGSPILDGGAMDWQVWDDMVNQYGIEVQTTNSVSATGAGHLGLLHFL